MANEIDVAYAAGFFDGEGSVGFIRVNSKRSASYKVLTSVMNTDRPILEWLQGQFGGKIYRHEFKGKPANWRAGFQWHIDRAELLEPFLVAIRPHLRIKGPLVDNALEAIAVKRRIPRAGGSGGRTPLDILTRLEVLAAIHTALITRGKPGEPVVPVVVPDPQMEMLGA